MAANHHGDGRPQGELQNVVTAGDQLKNASDDTRMAAGNAFMSEVNAFREAFPKAFNFTEDRKFDANLMSKLNIPSANDLLGDQSKNKSMDA